MTIRSDQIGPDAKRGRLRERVSDVVNDHLGIVLVGLPALVLLILFIWPVIWVLYQSLWVDYPGVPARFDPIYNYHQVVIRTRFLESVRRTLFYAFGSLLLSVTSGLVVALALDRVGKRWLRTAYVTVLTFGWALPVSVLALTWRWILHDSSAGLLNQTLIDIGLIHEPIAYLFQADLALLIVTLIDAWVRMPLAMLIFLSGLQTVPNRMYEASRIDGATTLQRFRHVTLPYLRPHFLTVCLIVWLFAFQAFSVIWNMTGGGPHGATETVSLFIFEVGIYRLNFSFGSAISAFLVIISLIFTAFYVRYLLDRSLT